MALQRNGLPYLLMEFFRANPDEELTFKQVAVKFGSNPSTVSNAVARLVGDGMIENVRVVRLPAKGRASNTVHELEK